jgi:putative addiction module killer protein
VIAIREYIDSNGRSPFSEWLDELNSPAAERVNTALYRLESGNFSNVKAVGAGVLECRIHFGPGYRVYFGKDGERLIILVGGGTKQRQSRDIERAIACWADYRRGRKVKPWR